MSQLQEKIKVYNRECRRLGLEQLDTPVISDRLTILSLGMVYGLIVGIGLTLLTQWAWRAL